MSDDLKQRLCKFEGGDKYGSTVWYRNPDGPEAADRIEKLEAALDDAMQYVSRADWHYLKDETRKALDP